MCFIEQVVKRDVDMFEIAVFCVPTHQRVNAAAGERHTTIQVVRYKRHNLALPLHCMK